MEAKGTGSRPKKRNKFLKRSRPRSTEGSTGSDDDWRLISRFVSRIEDLPNLQAVVLFGSFARGDADRRSDVDVLLVLDRDDLRSVRSQVAAILSELKPHREITPTITNLRDVDASFLRNVFREGKVLHGKLLLDPTHLGLEPRTLIAYDLTGRKSSDKVQISRTVHGYKSRKTVNGKSRVYEYPGLMRRPGAILVSRSAILLRSEDAGELVGELERRKISFSRWEVYL